MGEGHTLFSSLSLVQCPIKPNRSTLSVVQYARCRALTLGSTMIVPKMRREEIKKESVLKLLGEEFGSTLRLDGEERDERERLNFADFQRAKSVCSSWFSTSTTVTKNQIPLLILFPDKNHDNCCRLFNPEEKDRLYKTKDFGVGFAKSVCIATYGNWLLMQDSMYNLYILHLFTRERINLPSVESQLGKVKVERTIYDEFRIIQDESESEDMSIRSPVFWIDEKSKDYIVLWGLKRCCVVSAKKGDTSWSQIPNTSDCCDMVYKDHKLYFLSNAGTFQLLVFSGDINFKTFKQVHLCIDNNVPFRGTRLQLSDPWWIETKLVVTVTGNVLEVRKMWTESRTCSFSVQKISSSGLFKKYEKVDSLGDEAMLWDLGITVPANDIEVFNRNCIYFCGSPRGFHEKNTSNTEGGATAQI
ncbi:unnamed protein product [Arabidopsis thaliana]|uniref:KIB1-4 beta-propeller domain-containing protein n=1 Tax=Arabidopsis thaliana TaxID=3702 RepID=A0A5S9XVK8_ARATH|nr:unnamed protein product [Arabidopsis thaliana]